jgi:large subunit ribosomal protein L4
MKVKVYNQEGKEVEEVELPDEVFGVKMNKNLVHQAVVAQMANSRQAIAHTKDRSEVSGGGKKPWRQKGTGRARHGSIRSPLWRGGGVTFGPTNERNFSQKINKKMKKKALLIALSEKARINNIIILDKLELEKIKAKEMAGIIKGMGVIKKDIKRGVLIALADKNENVIKAARNIPKLSTIAVNSLNLIDVMKFKYLIMTKDGIDKVKEVFSK